MVYDRNQSRAFLERDQMSASAGNDSVLPLSAPTPVNLPPLPTSVGAAEQEQIYESDNSQWPMDNDLYMDLLRKDKLQLLRRFLIGAEVTRPDPKSPQYAARRMLWVVQMAAKESEKDVVHAIHAPLHDDDMNVHLGAIPGPSQTPFEGGLFFLRITFLQGFPFTSPIVNFITKVYHPNIDARGAICLDVLGEQWSPALATTGLLVSITSLLGDPNPNDPYVPEIAHTFKTDRAAYERNARQYVRQYANLPWPTEEMLARPSVTYDWRSAG